MIKPAASIGFGWPRYHIQILFSDACKRGVFGRMADVTVERSLDHLCDYYAFFSRDRPPVRFDVTNREYLRYPDTLLRLGHLRNKLEASIEAQDREIAEYSAFQGKGYW